MTVVSVGSTATRLVVNIPAVGAPLAERDGLLGGQVNDDEPINASLVAVLHKALLSVAEQGVVVAHEQDGGAHAELAGIADHLQGRLDRDAILEGNLCLGGPWSVAMRYCRQGLGLTVLAVWMVGPSAIGSVNGTPSSMMSAPPFAMERMTLGVAAAVG